MQGSHDPALVLLSIVTAVIASFVALDMASRVASARRRSRRPLLWVGGGALAMGTGIWAMHFVGMLAFSLPVPLAHALHLTLAAWLVAVLSSALALQTVSRPRLGRRRLVAAAILMGAGIAATHYLGMAALQMTPGIVYSPLPFVLSVLLAVVASTVALQTCFRLRDETAVTGLGKKGVGALAIGGAIAGMHYTGMAAANFAEGSMCTAGPYSLGGSLTAFGISGLVALFLLTTLLRSVYRAMRPTVRSRLVFLVVAAILPVSLMAIVVMVCDYQRLRTQQAHSLMVSARALVATVDRDLAGVEMGLRMLSTSGALDAGDLPAFHAQASEALNHLRVSAILLEDGNGRLLMDTGRPMRGVHVARTAEPAITVSIPVPQLDFGSVDRTPVLRARIVPERLAELLQRQRLAKGWVATVYAADGTVVARSQDVSRFIGAKGPPALLKRRGQLLEDAIDMVALDGTPVLSAFSRSESGRTASISIPQSALSAALLPTMAWLLAGLLAMLSIGLLLAWRIGGTIAGAVQALTAPALALGSGKPVSVPPLGLTEADKVGRALLQAARLLDTAQHDANHDGLTGLANRSLFRQMIHQQLALAQRNNSDLSVLYIDLDGFKGVNDSHGHAVGDALLQHVAHRLQQGVRAGDVVARLGGDEFAVALTQSGPAGPGKVARKLIDSLCRPFLIDGVMLNLSASIGGASYCPESAASCDALLAHADAAMYQAKQAGKRRFVFAAQTPIT
jgi:diguanylate cyclase (GGDEF)-like protein